MKIKSTHGGRRKGSGRPSLFRGKSSRAEKPLYKNIPPAMQLLLTTGGRALILHNCKRLSTDLKTATGNKKARISRNDYVEGLIRKYGHLLMLEDLQQMALEGSDE